MSKSPPEAYRSGYAEQIARLTDLRDGRIKEAFATIPRETFLPAPPWTTISSGIAAQTSELADIYGNVLVVIDRERGINNGEPALHAAWLDTVSPQPDETVIHVGAGTGYYTAILSHLVGPGGRVEAYEYQEDLAAKAERNLSGCSNVKVHPGSAFGRPLPPADVIYVNAGVPAPDAEWLRALKSGARLIFPWQPDKDWGPTVLVKRMQHGFRARPLMIVGFISCSGASEKAASQQRLTETDFASIRSVWITRDRAPDESAVAVYEQVWFSSQGIEG